MLCLYQKEVHTQSVSSLGTLRVRKASSSRFAPANERRRYKVTPSLNGWAQILNQLCTMTRDGNLLSI